MQLFILLVLYSALPPCRENAPAHGDHIYHYVQSEEAAAVGNHGHVAMETNPAYNWPEPI